MREGENKDHSTGAAPIRQVRPLRDKAGSQRNRCKPEAYVFWIAFHPRPRAAFKPAVGVTGRSTSSPLLGNHKIQSIRKCTAATLQLLNKMLQSHPSVKKIDTINCRTASDNINVTGQSWLQGISINCERICNSRSLQSCAGMLMVRKPSACALATQSAFTALLPVWPIQEVRQPGQDSQKSSTEAEGQKERLKKCTVQAMELALTA